MSSLYQMIMGQSPIFGQLALAVGISREFATENDLGRVRDAWISEDAKTICILHRNYEESNEHCHENVKKLPTFVANHSWESDPTYAWWEFSVVEDGPEEMYNFLKLAAEKTDNRNCMERYHELIENMQNPDKQDDPDVQHAMEAGKKIINGLKYAMQEGIAEPEHNGGSVVITANVSSDLLQDE